MSVSDAPDNGCPECDCRLVITRDGARIELVGADEAWIAADEVVEVLD